MGLLPLASCTMFRDFLTFCVVVLSLSFSEEEV